MHRATKLMREAACQFVSGEHTRGQRTIREAQDVAQRRGQHRLMSQCTLLRVCMSEGVHKKRRELSWYDGLTPRCSWERLALWSRRWPVLAVQFVVHVPVILVVALWWLARPWAWRRDGGAGA